MFAEQLELDRQKLMAHLALQGRSMVDPVAPNTPRGEAAFELASIDNSGPPRISGEVDVARTPPQPPVPPGPSRKDKTTAACQYCGKLFKASKVGLSVMQRNRHVKKTHPEESLG